MATSGTTTFNLSIDDLIEEAFERCGMRPTSGYQLTSARRSLNLLFLDWANRGLNLWTIEQATYALTAGVNEISLDASVVNVLEAVIRQNNQGINTDVYIERISREDWLNVPDKTTQARPAQFYVQRTNIPKVFFYPAADQDYTFVYYRIRRIQDAGAYTNDADVNFRFLPCLTSGLAYYLALKFAADRAGALKAIYEEDFQRAALEDRDTASVQFVPDLGV
jgi:Uma2 family endonuclease